MASAGKTTMHTRELREVTLVAVSDVALAATARALRLSQRCLRFGEVLLLSGCAPPANLAAVWRRIDPIASREDYSRFMLRDLVDHVATSHALCIQWDGYVLDPSRWDPDFLAYDYIGAPWPHFAEGQRVGNGGFSLRSRRLLEACHELELTDQAEDVAICRTYRNRLERDFAIRFAPEDVARRFAYERISPTGSEFGFHGAFNLPALVASDELTNLLDSIEPGLLNRREHREMLVAALRTGRLGLARVLWRRLRHPGARRR